MAITPNAPANFTPEMGNTSYSGYTGQGSFRFWCQKVLPLVYDDSLSYYETLCKVVAYLNNVISDISSLEGNFEELDTVTKANVEKLLTAYNELQGYVNDYFSTLDVQEEINKKLDEMAEDGSLSALIQPLFDEYKKEIDDTVSSQNSQIEEQKNEVKILKERMGTFSSLPDGSTSGDAELVDIRIAWDGKKYTTAGDSVRTQSKDNFILAQNAKYKAANGYEKNIKLGPDAFQSVDVSDKVVFLSPKNQNDLFVLSSPNIQELTEFVGNKCTLTNKYYGFTANYVVDSTNWLDFYANIKITGLTIGNKYQISYNDCVATKNGSPSGGVPWCYIFNSDTPVKFSRMPTTSYPDYDNFIVFEAPSEELDLRIYLSQNVDDYEVGTALTLTVSGIVISNEYGEQVMFSPVTKIEMYPAADFYRLPTGDKFQYFFEGDVYSVSDGSIDKTVLLMGDSITGAYIGTDREYGKYLKEISGYNVITAGFGGCRMGCHPASAYNAFSMYELAKAIKNGNYSLQDENVSREPSYAENLSNLKSIDFNNIDVLIINYGTNDFGGGYDCPSPTFEKNNAKTFGGAIQISIENLYAKYPHLKIVLVSPIFICNFETSEGPFNYHPELNHDYVLNDYIECENTVAKQLGIEIVNPVYDMGVNEYNVNTFYTANDGVHPNVDGMKKLDEYIYSKIK